MFWLLILLLWVKINWCVGAGVHACYKCVRFFYSSRSINSTKCIEQMYDILLSLNDDTSIIHIIISFATKCTLIVNDIPNYRRKRPYMMLEHTRNKSVARETVNVEVFIWCLRRLKLLNHLQNIQKRTYRQNMFIFR